MKRIGIMGGTFDPVHNGHLLLGRQARSEYGLDEIWYMPSHIPPHKKDHRITDGKDRLATYTAQTLELLKEEYPEDKFYFIIGADSLFQLETWYHPEKVMELTSLLVSGREYDRAGRTLDQQISYLKSVYGAHIQVLHNPEMNVASARIRDMAARGEDIGELVPGAVAAYIREHRLYQESR